MEKEIEKLKALQEEEEAEQSEEDEEEAMSPEEFDKYWLSENLTEDMVGSKDTPIIGFDEYQGLQDHFEKDMVDYYNDNQSEMSQDVKEKWKEELSVDDGNASHHEDVGVLADNIQYYFENQLKVPKSKMQEWSDFWEKKKDELN